MGSAAAVAGKSNRPLARQKLGGIARYLTADLFYHPAGTIGLRASQMDDAQQRLMLASAPDHTT